MNKNAKLIHMLPTRALHSLVLVSLTHQTLYLLHFDEEKMFQHLVPAQDLLELVWVVILPHEKENASSFSTHWCWYSSQILEWINNENHCTTLLYSKDIQRLKGIEKKYISHKWKLKNNWGSNTYIRQNRLYIRTVKEKKRAF